MTSLAAIGSSEKCAGALLPGGDHAVDPLSLKGRPVRQTDDRGFGRRGKIRETAAERHARPALPVGALDHPGAFGLEEVRARDYDDLLDRARPHALEDAREEEALLRGAEAGGRASRQHHRGDHGSWSNARRTRARAISSLYSFPGSGVAPSRSSGESSAHGTGATPARASRVRPETRAAATPTIANENLRRSIAFR